MSIQSNINQMISLAGVAARLNPSFAAQAERRTKISNLENLVVDTEQAIQSLGDSTKGLSGASKQQQELATSLMDRQGEALKELFEIDPSNKRLRKWFLGTNQTYTTPAFEDELEAQAEMDEYAMPGPGAVTAARPTLAARAANNALNTEANRIRRGNDIIKSLSEDMEEDPIVQAIRKDIIKRNAPRISKENSL